MARVACRADVCYNLRRKLLCSKDARNTLRTLAHLIRRCTMDILSSNDPERKQCTGTCGRFLLNTPEFFHRNGKDKLYPKCKECKRKQAKERYNQPEIGKKIRDSVKAYRAENQEHVRAHKKEYYSKPEIKARKLDYTREYRTRPGVLDKKHAQAKVYNDRPDVQERRRPYDRTVQHNRNARIKGNGGSHTVQDIQAKLQRQKGKCYYCKEKMVKYHIDHVIPISRGGSNDISNIVLACPPCNQHKQSRMPHEWPEGGRLL